MARLHFILEPSVNQGGGGVAVRGKFWGSLGHSLSLCNVNKSPTNRLKGMIKPRGRSLLYGQPKGHQKSAKHYPGLMRQRAMKASCNAYSTYIKEWLLSSPPRNIRTLLLYLGSLHRCKATATGIPSDQKDREGVKAGGTDLAQNKAESTKCIRIPPNRSLRRYN